MAKKSKAERDAAATKKVEDARRVRDLAMMKNPDAWPRWPTLPLKRRGGGDGTTGMDFGYIGDPGDEKTVTLYKTGLEGPAVVVEFASYEALFDAGWVVD